jgi:hypothetical protein
VAKQSSLFPLIQLIIWFSKSFLIFSLLGELEGVAHTQPAALSSTHSGLTHDWRVLKKTKLT